MTVYIYIDFLFKFYVFLEFKDRHGMHPIYVVNLYVNQALNINLYSINDNRVEDLNSAEYVFLF